MAEWVIEVPGPAPAVNSTYKVVVAGGKVRLAKRSEVAIWQESVAWLVKASRPKDFTPARRVLITIEWFQARKRDCDAGVKAALDAVATGLGVDDSIFLLSVPTNEIDKVAPRTRIRINNVGEVE